MVCEGVVSAVPQASHDQPTSMIQTIVSSRCCSKLSSIPLNVACNVPLERYGTDRSDEGLQALFGFRLEPPWSIGWS